MGTIEKIRNAETDKSWTAAFANGFSDGQAARDRNQPLRPYVRVGIDDYARGYRQGFFARSSSSARGPIKPSRQVFGL